ncbi:MAG: LysR family transcriptional regulator [Pseudomonadota bacterium]
MKFDDLALFTTVARLLNFSEAGRQTGIPLSRVSRRIAELEDDLGVKLFERTTRQVRLTEEGRLLLDKCQAPIEELQAVSGITGNSHQQTIRITAPPLAARISIGPRLLEFASQNPQVKVVLTTTNVTLDFYRDNIDLAFRLGPLTDSDLVARRLWSVPYAFCAGTLFAKEHGISKRASRQEILRLPAVLSRQPWFLENGEKIKPVNVVHWLDDLDLVQTAVKSNMGIALLPLDLIENGMVRLQVADTSPMHREMFAVYPGRRLLPARIRNLIDFMAASAP